MLGFGDITAKIAISNLIAEKKRIFTAFLNDRELIYDDTLDDKLQLKIAPKNQVKTVALTEGRPLERALQAFSAAIQTGEADFKDAELGRDVVAVLERLPMHVA